MVVMAQSAEQVEGLFALVCAYATGYRITCRQSKRKVGKESKLWTFQFVPLSLLKAKLLLSFMLNKLPLVHY